MPFDQFFERVVGEAVPDALRAKFEETARKEKLEKQTQRAKQLSQAKRGQATTSTCDAGSLCSLGRDPGPLGWGRGHIILTDASAAPPSSRHLAPACSGHRVRPDPKSAGSQGVHTALAMPSESDRGKCTGI